MTLNVRMSHASWLFTVQCTEFEELALGHFKPLQRRAARAERGATLPTRLGGAASG